MLYLEYSINIPVFLLVSTWIQASRQETRTPLILTSYLNYAPFSWAVAVGQIQKNPELEVRQAWITKL